jgi:predicted transposase/invertase (TIGR01784 family)
MSEIVNPHDRFCKDLFARPEVAADFLAHYLPPEVAAALDLRTLELVKDSFIDPELQPHFSDLLYRAQLKRGGPAFIYVLFEHKSAPDVWAAFQLLRYEVRIWEPLVRQQVKQLPPIFPLVLYHGRRRWRVKRNFSALVALADEDALRKYVPEFEYHLFDLSAYSDAEIKGVAFLQAGLLLMKHIFSQGLALRLADILAILPLPEQSAIEYLATIARYLSAATWPVTETDFGEAIKKAFPKKAGGIMPVIGETWIQKGRQEGRQEGLQEGTAALTLRLLQRRIGVVDDQTQERIRALSCEQLGELGEALLDFTSPDDLTQWLREHTRNGSAASTQRRSQKSRKTRKRRSKG